MNLKILMRILIVFENTNENINLYNDLNELFNLLCYKNSYDEKIYEIIMRREGMYSDT